ncbi:LacI family DNA-binding transcriptional regulator [Aquamicrobium sp. LC103]|uniref:LacI family DNA-binding transcriptional regulator n=1 Tax=Aquamicrobium sp. LC103 TaxID=1120658 RepID=UPI00069956A3|nr:LacI family DNA-binding transcriptional regulator [Aquamicrobium sp. LC103]TKT69612.1 LacI family DNA-binding transcriptional regulator [Aquamicrobium sp. LC103]
MPHFPSEMATPDPVERVPVTEPSDGIPPIGQKVRIEEVAALAGVSPITVSRALRNPAIVSEARRKRIEEVVTKTGYASNPHASALKSGRSNLVAAFLSNITSQQYTAAAEGCAKVLEEAGYHLVIARTSYSYARETTLIRALMTMRPAAAFITGVMELEENRIFLRNLKVPIVESWAYASDPIDMLVGFSNTDGVQLVVDHLAEKGYRKVGFVGRSSGRGTIRLNAFLKGAEAAGIEIKATLTVANVQGIADGRQALRSMLAASPDMDAVFCANDLLGIGAMLEARAMGLNIPGDLAIVGFGDSEVAAEVPPGMTTVVVDAHAIGEKAGEMLLARLTGQKIERPSCLFPVRLEVRGSS